MSDIREHRKDVERREAPLAPVGRGIAWAGFWIAVGLVAQSEAFWAAL